MPPGKDGGTRRRALRLDVVIIETDALIRQLIDAWRVYRAAIHPKFPQPMLSTRMKMMLGEVFTCPLLSHEQSIRTAILPNLACEHQVIRDWLF
jgi:hypothetical protein